MILISLYLLITLIPFAALQSFPERTVLMWQLSSEDMLKTTQNTAVLRQESKLYRTKKETLV